MKRDNRSIIVLGNGASLRGFDFRSLQSINTIGMNAAYRHWEKINWYPDYYVCVDDQMMQTHHQAIRAMVKQKKVKSALLRANILDYHPDFLDLEGVYFLESFQILNQESPTEKYRVPKIFAKEFQSSEPSKITTGAYSVRFAAFLGYKEITMLGVDLKYQEIIPEAAYRGGSRLEIIETPKRNPNYFFDDYQRKGDRYNIPNPPIYNESLHVDSFRVLARDSVSYDWHANIYNSNLSSVLYEDNIFPFLDIHDLVSQVKRTEKMEQKNQMNRFLSDSYMKSHYCCHWCKSEDTSYIIHYPLRRAIAPAGMYYCNSCGSISVNVVDVKNHYPQSDEKAVLNFHRRVEDRNRKWAKILLRKIDEVLPAPTKAVIDIGCGTGTLLSEASKLKKIAIGYEVSSLAVEESKKHLGVVVHNEIFTQKTPGYENGLVNCTAVLEHLIDPVALIKDIASHCRTNSSSAFLFLPLLPENWNDFLLKGVNESRNPFFDNEEHITHASKKAFYETCSDAFGMPGIELNAGAWVGLFFPNA